jgi:LysM repeat protein
MSDSTPPQPRPKLASTTTSTTARNRPLYTVRSGDTLGKIASRFNTTVDQLKTWNHLTSTRLSVGKKLIIGTEKTEAAN